MKLFIGIPSYAASCSMQFTSCLLALAKHYTGKLDLSFHIGHCYIGKARNELTADFLKSDCDKFLQIDNDVLFTPEDVKRISSHTAPIVGGFYFKKQAKREAVCEALDGQSGSLAPNEDGLVEVKYIGTGFLCVDRLVFQRMRANWGAEPWFWYINEATQEKFHDFWPHGVHPKLGRWLGEDWYFCHRARELGFKVYGDTLVRIPHLGSVSYPLPEAHPASSLAAPGAAPE